MIFTVPGWQSSGPAHWQSQWEKLDASIVRIEQDDWEQPSREAWTARLLERVGSGRPCVLVAHSLGCHLVAHAADQLKSVVGALLVAPPSLETPGLPSSVLSFGPPATHRLPFESVLVASSNDQWCSIERSRELARAWGSRFVEAGAAGHLNSDSQLGSWPAGRALLAELTRRLPFVLDERLRRDTQLVGQSDLNSLLLFDDARYPWLVLVPRRAGVSELFELSAAEREQLMRETNVVAEHLARVFNADKMNVGALGNVVRQFHVHVVARQLGDPAWPGPVWGHSPRVARTDEQRRELIARLWADGRLAQHFLSGIS
ncbi:MAG: alpha/beta fold hydrolase [Archangium sp.]